MDAIEFIKGKGKKVKAQYKIGNAIVPASAVTRLVTKIKDLEPKSQEVKFTVAIGGKYEDFLVGLDLAGISISAAIEYFAALGAKSKTPKRSTREVRIVSSIAKLLARTYLKKTPEEMADEFLSVATSPTFKVELVSSLTNFEEEFGRNKQMKIRICKERPEMVEKAEKARMGKAK